MVRGWSVYEKPRDSPDRRATMNMPSAAPTTDPTIARTALWKAEPRFLLYATTAEHPPVSVISRDDLLHMYEESRYSSRGERSGGASATALITDPATASTALQIADPRFFAARHYCGHLAPI